MTVARLIACHVVDTIQEEVLRRVLEFPSFHCEILVRHIPFWGGRRAIPRLGSTRGLLDFALTDALETPHFRIVAEAQTIPERAILVQLARAMNTA